MFKKLIVVDAHGHLAGRMASYVAKAALSGQRVTIVRAEKTLISGSLHRNKVKIMEFHDKRMSTNPKKGPIHQRTPSQILFRKIRGMIPHKTPIGKAAMGRVKIFDGCPLSLNATKKFCIRDALKCIRLKPRSRYTNLGDVATCAGWTKGSIINKFEAKRAGNNREWHLRRVKARTTKCKSLENNADLKKVNAELAKLGY
jgi:large subunit ribosomal protein L13Ae